MGNIYHPNPLGKRTRERLKMATVRIRTYIWEEGEASPISGFSFVADFSEDGIGIYLDRAIRITAYTRVAFESPDAPAFRARTVWCARFSMEQKFIGHEGLQYRAGLQLIFGTEDERTRYHEYLREIRGRVRIMVGDE